MASSYVPGLTPSLQNAPRTAAYEVPNWLQHGNGTGAVGTGGNKVGLYTGQGKYTLYDNRTGKVLAEGSSPEELKSISDIISGTLVPQGNKADWRLYSSNPVIQNRPHREFRNGGEGPLKLDGNPFGDTIQGYNDLSTPGDPRGMVIAGDMPNNFVKDMLVPLLTPAALAAGAYFGGGALLGAKGAAGAGGLASITPASAANTALASLANVPIAAGLPSTALPGLAAVAPAAASAAPAAGFTVTGAKLIPTVADKLAALTPGLGPGLAQALMQPPTSPPATPSEIVVNANKSLSALKLPPIVPPVVNIPPVELPPISPPAPPEVEVPTGEDQIVVEGRKTPFPIKMTDIVPPLTSVPLSTLPSTPPTTPPKTEVDSGLSTMDKIRLGLLGAGLLSDVAGGDGGGPAGRIPGGLGGGLAPVFNAPLPKANLPVSTPRTASDVGGIDYYRYGYGPEQSFYTNVPKGEPNTSRAYTGYEELEGLAEGGQPTPRGALPMVEGNIDLHKRPVVRNEDGTVSTVKSRSFGFDVGEVLLPTVSEDGRVMSDEEAVDQFRRTGRHLGVFATPEEATEYGQRLHEDQEREYAPRSNFAVGGPGDGRDDKIPAMLSDGEYVIDAETVALLGNGSNKAGAEALNKFRVNVRKHKGGKLAKGAFSVAAKRPEQYLKGRK